MLLYLILSRKLWSGPVIGSPRLWWPTPVRKCCTWSSAQERFSVTIKRLSSKVCRAPPPTVKQQIHEVHKTRPKYTRDWLSPVLRSCSESHLITAFRLRSPTPWSSALTLESRLVIRSIAYSLSRPNTFLVTEPSTQIRRGKRWGTPRNLNKTTRRRFVRTMTTSSSVLSIDGRNPCSDNDSSNFRRSYSGCNPTPIEPLAVGTASHIAHHYHQQPGKFPMSFSSHLPAF